MLNIPAYRTWSLVLLILISIGTLTASAQIPGFGGPAKVELKDLNEIPPEEVDSYLATLSDAQARELLIKQIKNRSAPQSTPSMMDSSYISYAIMSLHDRSERFESEFNKISYASQHYGSNLSRVLEAMFFTEGMSAIPKVSLTLLILLAVGGLIVTFAFRPMRDFRQKLAENGEYPIYVRLGRSAVGLALDLGQVGLFVVVTVPLTFLFFDELDPIRVLAASVLILVATIWAIRNVLKEMLYSPVSRDLYIKDDQCRKIYYWSMIGFFVPTILSLLLQGLLGILRFPSELMRLNSLALASFSILSLIVGVFLIAREKRRQHDIKPDILNTAVSNNKHWLIITVLVIFYVIFFKNIVIAEDLAAGETGKPGYAYFALLMFIFMPMYLRLVYLLITIQPAEAILGTDDDTVNVPAEDFKPNKWVRIIFVAPYAILIFLFTMEGANIGLLSWFSEGGGADFGQGATGVFVASMLGVVAWNVVNAYINKNLPDIALDPTALMGSEGGGDEAATRMQTVLPIVRNFALALIFVVVTFSILSSIGVNTAPLLAGAGVIGIAIGFGAQKLVQDVVSGMFFLFEDAFRIGEYIDTGSLVGTVESTSVRSLKLRHHLGAVQTIPYGEIRSIKNLSRDFVIMKLKFRVPFDTDIELVRKIIKKVGQELLKDEELGEDFIAPLKSQGVQTAEDDALVIRMKFTCKPGKQWMIKRSAYRLVQEALAAKGIHFASRQVTVHVPDNENIDSAAIKQAAGAAALAIDAEKSNKPVDPLADM
jgi:small-conductance mechanosensitive channel